MDENVQQSPEFLVQGRRYRGAARFRCWTAPLACSQPPGPHAGCTPFANQPLDNLNAYFLWHESAKLPRRASRNSGRCHGLDTTTAVRHLRLNHPGTGETNAAHRIRSLQHASLTSEHRRSPLPAVSGGRHPSPLPSAASRAKTGNSTQGPADRWDAPTQAAPSALRLRPRGAPLLKNVSPDFQRA